jgi:hypothetical protein
MAISSRYIRKERRGMMRDDDLRYDYRCRHSCGGEEKGPRHPKGLLCGVLAWGKDPHAPGHCMLSRANHIATNCTMRPVSILGIKYFIDA